LARNLGILKNLSASERKRSLLLTLGGGALLTANWYFFIFAMNHISIKAAAYAYLICPIITTVLAYFFLKEKLKLHQWLAVLLSVVSCGILAFGHWVDLFYSLVVAFSYAFYLITQRKNVHLERFFCVGLSIDFFGLVVNRSFGAHGGCMVCIAFFFRQYFFDCSWLYHSSFVAEFICLERTFLFGDGDAFVH
jgi:chloramphenicol-sensitive protein RarD